MNRIMRTSVLILIQVQCIFSFSVKINPVHIKRTFGASTKLQNQLGTGSVSGLQPYQNTLSGDGDSSHHSRENNILSCLSFLYPPEGLSDRNAISRTDGYWKFISVGEEPPQTLTYGEFDFLFFADLLDKVLSMHGGNASEKTFIDIGSGTGRIVIGAAALRPELKLCRGLEILPGIHDKAVESLNLCKVGDNAFRLPRSEQMDASTAAFDLAPIALSCGSFTDAYEYWGDADVVFVFSTCFTPEMMSNLSDSIGRQCKPGTIIITTEYKLNSSGSLDPLPDPEMPHGDYEIDLVESLDGLNWVVGGQSTAHIQILRKSVGDGKGPSTRPIMSSEDVRKEEAKEALNCLEPPKQLSFEEFLKSH